MNLLPPRVLRGIPPDDAELLEVVAPAARVLAEAPFHIPFIVDARPVPRVEARVLHDEFLRAVGHLAQARPVGRDRVM